KDTTNQLGSVEGTANEPESAATRKRGAHTSSLAEAPAKKRKEEISGIGSTLQHEVESTANRLYPPTDLYLDTDTMTLTEDRPVLTYSRIAHEISESLGTLEKKKTILHFDGAPSIEKSGERERRRLQSKKQIDEISSEINRLRQTKKKIPAKIYDRIKNVFRPPPEAFQQIKEELSRLGWTVCQCEFQSDTCIALHCREKQAGNDTIVLTRDSDLICYDEIETVAMPVGRKHELHVFTKSGVTEYLGLPSPLHLLLVAIATTNDYVQGIRQCGIKTNAKYFCHLTLDEGLHNSDSDVDALIERRVKMIKVALSDYIGNRRKSPEDFNHAIEAFVRCQEHSSIDAVPSAQTHELVEKLLESLKTCDQKHSSLNQRQASSSSNRTSRIESQPGSRQLKRTIWRKNHKNSPNYKSKRQQYKKNYNKKRKREKSRRPTSWNSFSSTDQGRYSSHIVRDLTKASKVDQESLSKMTESAPRPSKPKSINTKSQPKNSKGNLNKKKRRGGKAPAVGSTKELKSLFKNSFRYVTETLGCAKACILRATTLTNDEALAVSNLIEEAVHILNTARILAFRALRLFLVSRLEDTSNIISEDSTSDVANTIDPLDLLLTKKHGRTIMRNLVTLVVNGKIQNTGAAPTDENVLKDRSIAEEIYAGLKEAIGNNNPIKTRKLTLKIPQKAMAHKMADCIRFHFRKIPSVVVNKMKKCGFPEDVIPNIEDEDEDESSDLGIVNEYDEDDDDDDNDGGSFQSGHIKLWWQELCRLPKSSRPVFCPSTGFSDTFLEFAEEAIIGLLWGGGKKGLNHPTRSIMESWMKRSDAEAMAKEDPGSLFHAMFIGVQIEVAEKAGVRQTSYGRQTTTMRALSAPPTGDHPGHVELQLPRLREHVRSLLKYRADLAKFKKSPLSTGGIPPERPFILKPNGAKRYASSNLIATDGLRIHLHAFDLKNPSNSYYNRVDLKNITAVYEGNPLSNDELQGAVVVGIDPGEVISASFCALDPEVPKGLKNLLVRRRTLYEPTLKYRSLLQKMKQHRHTKTVENSQGIPVDINTPSISELENCLNVSNISDSVSEARESLKRTWYIFSEVRSFYGSHKVKKLNFAREKAKRAEFDLSVAAGLSLVDPSAGCHERSERRAVFVYGNGKFNTRTKLASLHDSFRGYFFKKAQGLGYEVVIADEYLTSTICPTKACGLRLAKPTTRSCVCLNTTCQRWMHRDSLGAHNIAIIGQCYLETGLRPGALCRPSE
ncbi:hypothetical protein BGZ46_007981, partial [Entomortierella lignicola]